MRAKNPEVEYSISNVSNNTELALLIKKIRSEKIEAEVDELIWVYLYEPRLMNFKDMVRNIADLEDVRQDLLLKVLEWKKEKPDWWKEVKSKKGYMSRATFNGVINMTREYKKTFSYDVTDGESPQKDLTDNNAAINELNDKIDRDELFKRLEALISDFTEEEHKILLLCAEGIKPLEIARELGQDEKEVQKKCNRINNKLRHRIIKEALQNAKKDQSNSKNG